MKNLFKALAAFQQEVPVIHKATQGYGYTYADLPAIFEVINPIMAKHGLGFTQLMEGQSLRTTIFHAESGEDISSVTEIPQNVNLKGMNDFQVLGSAITYIRRYALSSALGLVTDKDNDAAGKQEQKPAKNTSNIPPKLIKEIADNLASIQDKEELSKLFNQYKKEASMYPSIKGMFTNKKVTLNGNA